MTVTVSILIGSESDLTLANKSSETLDSLSISNSIQVLSAHRTPELLETHVRECEAGGTKVFIAMAGLAAHLAGAQRRGDPHGKYRLALLATTNH